MESSENSQWPGKHKSSLRRRILRESRLAAQEYRRKPQQRFRAPPFAGTAAFDLKNGLSEVPRARRKRIRPCLQPATDSASASSEEMLTTSSDDYYAKIEQELDSIEKASVSQTSSYSSLLLKDNVPETHAKGFPEDVTETGFEDLWMAETELLINQPTTTPVTESAFEDLWMTETESMIKRPVTESQLMSEVKTIYTELTSALQTHRNILSPSTPEWTCYRSTKGLLQEYHDFFLASQHPVASPALKSLATRYAMPEHMWSESIKEVTDLLCRRPYKSERVILLFGNLCAETMQNFSENMPQLSDEWDMIKENLREYFIVLRADGLDIPLSVIDQWVVKHTAGASLRKWLYPPMRGRFFGDDDLPDWMLEAYTDLNRYGMVQDDFVDEPDDSGSSGDGLLGTAQLFMAGWLQYGRKIATSFHVFCQMAIFLATVMLAASLTPP